MSKTEMVSRKRHPKHRTNTQKAPTNFKNSLKTPCQPVKPQEEPEAFPVVLLGAVCFILGAIAGFNIQ